MEAKQWLAEHGYNKKWVPASMASIIQEKLKIPLADQLLFGELHVKETQL